MFRLWVEAALLKDPEPAVLVDMRSNSGPKMFRSESYRVEFVWHKVLWTRIGPLLRADGQPYSNGRKGAARVLPSEVPTSVLVAWEQSVRDERARVLERMNAYVNDVVGAVSDAGR